MIQGLALGLVSVVELGQALALVLGGGLGAAGGAGLKGGPDINDGYNDKGNPHKMKPGY